MLLSSIRSIETCYGRYKTESFHLFKGFPKFLFPFGWYFCPEALKVATLPLDYHSLGWQPTGGNPNCFQGVTKCGFRDSTLN
jgi:hypothetical protein